MGAVSLPGVGGMLVVRSGAGLASIAASGLHVRLLNFLEPRLVAQETATGALTLDDGTTSSLNGTANGTSFQLSGSDGYSVSVSGSQSGLSGTVTAPFGTGSVVPLAFSPSITPSAAADGNYVGTYSITTSGYFTNHNRSSGALTRSCGFQVVNSGTLTMFVDSGGTVAVQDDWQESVQVIPPCPNHTDFATTIIRPAGPVGGRFPIDRPQVQFGFVDRSNSSTTTRLRTFAFVGVVNTTTLQGRYLKSNVYSDIVANGTEEHREGYRMAETVVTLTKR